MPVHPFAPPRGRLEEFLLRSAAAGDNLLGDPASRRVVVYLPEDYDDTDAAYPLFVDLVGFTGSGLAHLSWRAFGENVPQRLDRLRSEGRMGPVVAVFPDCFTSLGGNQYVNSAAMGRWEDFLVDDLLPAVEQRFRVLPGRQHRAVFGKSSGGYGAIVHGLRRPDAWGAVACHSGDMGFDSCYRPGLAALPRRLRAFDGDVAAFLERLSTADKVTDDMKSIVELLAMAATYDPDPEAPKGIRLPVDLRTGRWDEAAWQRWRVHDPVVLAGDAAHQDNLRHLSGVYIDCGTEDQFELLSGARQLHETLDAAGVAHRYEEFDDNHSDIDYRMDESLPFLYDAVART